MSYGYEQKIDLTDDDDVIFDAPDDSILISSDEDNTAATEDILTSDEELPDVDLKAKKQAILNLFPPKKEPVRKYPNRYAKNESSQGYPSKKTNGSLPENSHNPSKGFPTTKEIKNTTRPSTSTDFEKARDPGIDKMIEGIKINLPVNPYGCQVALMSMVSEIPFKASS